MANRITVYPNGRYNGAARPKSAPAPKPADEPLQFDHSAAQKEEAKRWIKIHLEDPSDPETPIHFEMEANFDAPAELPPTFAAHVSDNTYALFGYGEHASVHVDLYPPSSDPDDPAPRRARARLIHEGTYRVMLQLLEKLGALVTEFQHRELFGIGFKAAQAARAARAADLSAAAATPPPSSPTAPGSTESPMPFSLDAAFSAVAKAHLEPAKQAMADAAQEILDRSRLRIPEQVKVNVSAALSKEVERAILASNAAVQAAVASEVQRAVAAGAADKDAVVAALKEVADAQRAVVATLSEQKKPMRKRIIYNQKGDPIGMEDWPAE